MIETDLLVVGSGAAGFSAALTASHAKGTGAYHRFNGDPTHGPNPCLAPLERAPFYAMRMIPGEIGTFLGLRVDGHARVLDGRGMPIRGLYAAGNDMTSVMGGTYPGAGITIGPALTFGYIAARHAAGLDGRAAQ